MENQAYKYIYNYEYYNFILGPTNFDNFADDFSEDYNPDQIPDIEAELKNFAKNPFNPKEPLTLDLLIEFINYDENGNLNLLNNCFN